ncbi:alpha/beta fold hydrolase [Pseudoduganella armeniaca]|uniref:Alpha/beta hydrolase n=1 Tax=Pseudoduganella armeniaca TaxID=2072590 RepID=A0A2R4C8R4_9BURK|nr:alpha/beta hydrolase [Pseudoduganella armeniaca]AVR96019.1 alpha/beta hydrolase [Pseudoduganella armeniaca]
MTKNLIHKAALCAAALAVSLSVHAASAFKAEVTGKGQPVILIPGLASSGEVWNDTVKHLCGPRQCHVLTLAGFAGQPAIDGPLLSQVEQELSTYIAANQLDKPIIVGHSLGGFLGLKFAIDHPDQLSRLVVVDSLPALGAAQAPDITPEQLRAMAAGARERMLAQDEASRAQSQRLTVASMVTKPEQAERIIEWGKRSDRTAVANAMAELLATDLRQDVARIKAPTLVLGTWIAYKQFAPREAIERNFAMQYARLPGVRIEMAESARHFIMVDDPAWMYDRIDRFLN